MAIHHIMCTSKVLTDSCFTKQRIKTKNTFARVLHIVSVVKMCWHSIKVYLSINGAQSVILEKGTIEFKNYFRQMPVTFKVYANFECNLESVESYEAVLVQKNYQDHIPCSFTYKLICVDDELSKLINDFRGENAAYEFIKAMKK